MGSTTSLRTASPAPALAFLSAPSGRKQRLPCGPWTARDQPAEEGSPGEPGDAAEARYLHVSTSPPAVTEGNRQALESLRFAFHHGPDLRGDGRVTSSFCSSGCEVAPAASPRQFCRRAEKPRAAPSPPLSCWKLAAGCPLSCWTPTASLQLHQGVLKFRDTLGPYLTITRLCPDTQGLQQLEKSTLHTSPSYLLKIILPRTKQQDLPSSGQNKAQDYIY